jgi:predicted nucleotidyltransferase component of viral defense system
MQMKAYVRKQAAKANIDPRLLLQEIVLDDLLERISLSQYRKNFVLKGGFLIASLLGVDTRSTHDLDTTIVGLPVTPDLLMAVFTEICDTASEEDPIELHPVKIEPIRDDDEYNGFRVHFNGLIYGKIKPQFKIDVSTGDEITPREVKYRHHLLTEDRDIFVMAYNVETILAEKLETIISRGVTNSRAKDFYDLYALSELERKNINISDLSNALINTATHRHTLDKIKNYSIILRSIVTDGNMQSNWLRYQQNNEFAQGISLADTCQVAEQLMDSVLL